MLTSWPRIRDLLAAHVKTSFVPRVEPGMSVVYREQAAQARSDLEEVDRWVIEHGGYLGKLPDQRHRGLGANYGRIRPGAVF